MRNAENAELPTTKPETSLAKMVNAIGDSLNDLACSGNVEDSDDKNGDEADPPVGKLSKDDEPGWVMGTVSITLWHQIERFGQSR